MRRLLLRLQELEVAGPMDPPSLLAVDAPDHTRYRRLISKEFTARAVARHEERIMSVAHRLLDELESTARDLAGTIATHAPLAMRALKRALRSSQGQPIERATEAVLIERRPLDQTRDYLEGMTAFKEKRRPVYTGE